MGKELDTLDIKMVFLRIGWMDRYQGLNGGDTISSGGAYVAERGYGHEIFNFQPFQRTMYGYVQPPCRQGKWLDAKINVTRIGELVNDKFISAVLAVWVATSPSGGGFVVGWYKNATVYRNWQPAPSGSARRYSDKDCGFYVTASSEDAVLLPPDERCFPILQKGKGAFGQSNIWYAKDISKHRQLRLNLLRYIESRQLPKEPQLSGGH